ncbi:MAG TPA: SCO family protein [Candidatus Acidoferrales bacterium]|nr:SCO family protein [Candidatus Acidoferrales bacterium]
MAKNRKLLRILLGAAAGLVITAGTWSVFRYGVERRSDLPVLGKVPAFALVDSNGRPVTQADLQGGVWVVDFIFTSCPNVCPALTSQMARLQEKLASRSGQPVRLVSITVDPAHDTPAALRAYADRFKADPSRWWFMTGERAALHSLIGSGFQLAVAERPESENTDGQGLITHSDRFVLVDRDLNIRAYYHGQEAESVQRILDDVERLGNNAANG